MDPLEGTKWSAPGTVRGFTSAGPNPVLAEFAREERRRGGLRALDVGCGAGRNAVPLAGEGWRVLGVDLSVPMLQAAARRGVAAGVGSRVGWVLAPMEAVPVADGSVDLIVAHGIWNLAPSAAVFRRAVAEAGRVARLGAALFVFTFSRNTFPTDVVPVSGEPFVFTQFSGERQCFLTSTELCDEMARAGFDVEPRVPMTEYNRVQRHGLVGSGGPPAIYEAAFRFRGHRG